ncbi:MAG: hypothetical protein IGS49_15725 [Chlorogloeopsis fritschii C42_A2020_084]|nr:hypothetical protein [Chlorogloeopsis fritschii C42_A2020_084]
MSATVTESLPKLLYRRAIVAIPIAHIQMPVSAVRASGENCLGSDRPSENLLLAQKLLDG